MRKIILDLCGGTGAWSQPWKDAGYDVRVITLPQYDVTLWNANEDNLNFIDISAMTGEHQEIPIKDIYGILAAPPCTMFSFARRTGPPRDFKKSMQLVSEILEIIWRVRMHPECQLEFWALENPVGYLRQFIGKPSFTFSQWQYGEVLTKRTDVFGYFNHPKKIVTVRPDVDLEDAWTNPKKPDTYKDVKLNRAAIRAITPIGFARAFYVANKKGKS